MSYVPNNNAIYNAARNGFMSGVYIARPSDGVTILSAAELAAQSNLFAQAIDGAIAPGSPSDAQVQLVEELCQSITANKYTKGFPASTFDATAVGVATIYNAAASGYEPIPPVPGNTIPGTITLEQYGAKGDGVTNDQPAFAAALAVLAASSTLGAGYQTIILGANRTYLVSGGTLPANCSIWGQGDTSCLKTVSNQPVIIIGGDGTECSNFQILGNFFTGGGDNQPNQCGIQNGQFGVGASGFVNVKIDRIFLNSLSTGVECNQYEGAHKGAFISDCIAEGCGGVTYGKGAFCLGTQAEYTNLIGCKSYVAEVGFNWGAGNCAAVGCIITDSRNIGIWIRGDADVTFLNDAHGTITGCICNHADSGNAVQVDATTHEMRFVGCDFYGGSIQLTSSTNVTFNSCAIDAVSYIFDGSQGTVFNGCSFPQAGTNTITNNANGHPSTTRWTDANWGPDGTFPAFILAGDDQTGWTSPMLSALQLPRQPNQTPLATDPDGLVGKIITDPTALPNLMLWLRGDLGITTVGGNVSVWADQSGSGDSGRNFGQTTAGDRPIYNASNAAFNDQATVHFAGSSVLLVSGTWSVPPPQATGTIFIVAKTGGGADEWLIGCLPADVQYAIFELTATQLNMDFSNNVNIATSAALSAGVVIICIDLNGAETGGYVCPIPETAAGLKVNATANPGATTCTGWTLGNGSGGGLPLNGDIAEIVVYSNRLPAGERQSVISYLSNRYNG